MLSASLFQWGGAVILLAVLVQAGGLLVSFFRGLAGQRKQQRLALELLEREVDVARGRAKFVETAQFSWPGYRKFKIIKKVEECKDVCSFYFVPHDGKRLPSFVPGQYLTFNLHVPGKAPGEVADVVRCYSLSDSPGELSHYRVTIKRIGPPPGKPDAPPGAVSSYFHGQLKEGDIVDVKAPSGSFCLDVTQSAPVVLIGGGIGLTPVLSMLSAVVESGSKREVWFFLGVMNGDQHAFREYLEKIAREHENVRLHVCYSDPKESEVAGKDFHHAERVSIGLFKRLLPSNNYDFYICGPPPMMQALTAGLTEWGVPEARIHFEAFGPASVKKAVPTPPAGAGAVKWAVTFSKSGKVLSWDSSVGSLLDLASMNGVPIDSGCRAGNCGTCITAIRSGSVDYLREPGSAPEKGSCLACVCVPKGDLVLDA